jgi:hypothetical protein
MPAQPSTVQLPAVPPWAIELTRSVKDGFQGVNARLDTVETNLDLQGQQGVDLGKRMTTLETRVGNIEERQNTGSLRVKQESQTNLNQDAAIAQIITEQAEAKKRDTATQAAVAQNTRITQEIRDVVVGVATNKKVIFVGKVLFGLAMAYAAAHGLKVLP